MTPTLASQLIEELMERKDVPECDRDEVRRFAEWLGHKKQVEDSESLAKNDPHQEKST